MRTLHCCFHTQNTNMQRHENKDVQKPTRYFTLRADRQTNLTHVVDVAACNAGVLPWRCVSMLTGLCVCVCARAAAAVVSRCLWEWPITRIRLVLYHRPARATVCTFPMKLTSFFSFLFFFPLPRQQVEGVFKESHEEWWEDVSKWGDRDQRTSPPFTTRWIRRASPDTLNISAYYYYYYYCTLSPCLHQRFKQNKKGRWGASWYLHQAVLIKRSIPCRFFVFMMQNHHNGSTWAELWRTESNCDITLFSRM